VGDGPTLHMHGRGVGARMARRGLPPLAIAGPARRPLRGSHPWDDDVGLRRALEDSVETGRHPLRVVAAASPSLPSSSSGESSSGSPLCLDFTRRVSSACRSRFSHRLSRSTSSSFTGGFEDRASIDPCTNEDKS